METQAKAFLAYLSSQPDYSHSTLIAYRSDLVTFINYLKSENTHKPAISDLNEQEVTHFLTTEKEAGRRKSTLIRRYSTLRQFGNYLFQQKLLKENPLSRESDDVIAVISGAISQSTSIYLTDAQVEQLLATLKKTKRPRALRDLTIISLLLETGLSISAIINLSLADVDLAGMQIRVGLDDGSAMWLRLEESGGALEEYLRDGRPQLNRSLSEKAVFISQMGGQMRRQGIWQILRHWGEAARLPMTLSPRLVRYTAARRQSQSGRSAAEICRLLGHRNPLSTYALLRRLDAAAVENQPVSPK
jgi:site-specific recombinase XerD